MSKIPTLLFALTAVIALSLLYCLVRPEPIGGHGTPHVDFPEMNRGGTPQRHDRLILIGGLYGGLQIVVLVGHLCLGIRRDRSSLLPLWIGGAAYLVTFAALVGTYARGMDNAPIVLGLPLPTSLMVFGMWGVPVIFVVFYIVNFRKWIYNEEDAQRFVQLLAQSRRSEPGEHSDG